MASSYFGSVYEAAMDASHQWNVATTAPVPTALQTSIESLASIFETPVPVASSLEGAKQLSQLIDLSQAVSEQWPEVQHPAWEYLKHKKGVDDVKIYNNVKFTVELAKLIRIVLEHDTKTEEEIAKFQEWAGKLAKNGGEKNIKPVAQHFMKIDREGKAKGINTVLGQAMVYSEREMAPIIKETFAEFEKTRSA